MPNFGRDRYLHTILKMNSLFLTDCSTNAATVTSPRIDIGLLLSRAIPYGSELADLHTPFTAVAFIRFIHGNVFRAEHHRNPVGN